MVVSLRPAKNPSEFSVAFPFKKSSRIIATLHPDAFKVVSIFAAWDTPMMLETATAAREPSNKIAGKSN